MYFGPCVLIEDHWECYITFLHVLCILSFLNANLDHAGLRDDENDRTLINNTRDKNTFDKFRICQSAGTP